MNEAMSKEPIPDENKLVSSRISSEDQAAAKKLAKQIAHRARLNNMYATDPEYREKCKEASRIYAAKRRERARDKRIQSGEYDDDSVGKPGRPRLARNVRSQ